MWEDPRSMALVHCQRRCAQCADKGGGQGHIGGKTIARLCTQNYSGATFIDPIRDPIPDPSAAPDTTGFWESNIRGL